MIAFIVSCSNFSRCAEFERKMMECQQFVTSKRQELSQAEGDGQLQRRLVILFIN